MKKPEVLTIVLWVICIMYVTNLSWTFILSRNLTKHKEFAIIRYDPYRSALADTLEETVMQVKYRDSEWKWDASGVCLVYGSILECIELMPRKIVPADNIVVLAYPIIDGRLKINQQFYCKTNSNGIWQMFLRPGRYQLNFNDAVFTTDTIDVPLQEKWNYYQWGKN